MLLLLRHLHLREPCPHKLLLVNLRIRYLLLLLLVVLLLSLQHLLLMRLNVLLRVRVGLELSKLLRRELPMPEVPLLCKHLLSLMQQHLLLLRRKAHATCHLWSTHHSLAHHRRRCHCRAAGTGVTHSLCRCYVAHDWCSMGHSRCPLSHLRGPMSTLSLLAP